MIFIYLRPVSKTEKNCLISTILSFDRWSDRTKHSHKLNILFLFDSNWNKKKMWSSFKR